MTPEALGDSTPFTILEVVMVVVEGPLMTKVEKSSLSWQIFELHGQISMRQRPLSPLDEDD